MTEPQENATPDDSVDNVVDATPEFLRQQARDGAKQTTVPDFVHMARADEIKSLMASEEYRSRDPKVRTPVIERIAALTDQQGREQQKDDAPAEKREVYTPVAGVPFDIALPAGLTATESAEWAPVAEDFGRIAAEANFPPAASQNLAETFADIASAMGGAVDPSASVPLGDDQQCYDQVRRFVGHDHADATIAAAQARSASNRARKK